MLLFHVPCKFVIRPHLSPLPVPQLPELLSNRNRLADTFFWSRPIPSFGPGTPISAVPVPWYLSEYVRLVRYLKCPGIGLKYRTKAGEQAHAVLLELQ